jgi:hypothetical protein
MKNTTTERLSKLQIETDRAKAGTYKTTLLNNKETIGSIKMFLDRMEAGTDMDITNYPDMVVDETLTDKTKKLIVINDHLATIMEDVRILTRARLDVGREKESDRFIGL